MRLVILGGSGSGKSTQAQRLCSHLDIPRSSTGEILRQAIAAQTELGKQAQPYVAKGELVPDEMMIEFIKERLLQPDVVGGWLLEGYPRTAFQAEELDFLLDELQPQLDWAIYLQVSEAVMMSRSVARSALRAAAKLSLPDDAPQIVQRRIDLFHKRTVPILEYYGYRERLLTINAEPSEQQVQQEILEKLKS
ncbi:MAG: nucleoside monophosphate kinase [Nostocaceae cyanobacterium]|nr:nucleoside monophosphate kinase [Nostocaceae cyanobacterium]